MTTPTTPTYPHPKLAEAPTRLLRPGNGAELLAWCERHDVTPPTLLHLERERARRGIRRADGSAER